MRAAILALSALLALAPAGCGKKRSKQAPIACEENGDCPRGQICLAGACADPSTKATYLAPETAVTPEKVKAHVEEVLEDQARAVDRAFERATADE